MCKKPYYVKIHANSWSNYFMSMAVDPRNHSTFLKKMFQEILWIAFQMGTLGLISRAFLNAFKELDFGLNQLMLRFKQKQPFTFAIVSNKVNSLISFLKKLVHPFEVMSNALQQSIRKIQQFLDSIVEEILLCCVDPIMFFRVTIVWLYKKITRFLLFVRLFILWLLILQHTASLAISCNILYELNHVHKMDWLRLDLCTKEEAFKSGPVNKIDDQRF
ncbi:hypothetical protein RFI_17754 [Reticulomyxa filosa]|uniref:Uncharacterized protein n=1 Tax=Reticulomyxa filosa TaxID=46433 RepID=X6N0A0_RETFI|nr:hypothetical protein RFI_17754 [Reticulomyxa filosa]|eukprot:ETO19476.1 hypothetical protein RFI_17754 [Reticulomyxa filosa]